MIRNTPRIDSAWKILRLWMLDHPQHSCFSDMIRAESVTLSDEHQLGLNGYKELLRRAHEYDFAL